MSPVHNGIGYSDATDHKYAGMTALLTAWRAQVDTIMSKGVQRRIVYVDLTAGDGSSAFLPQVRRLLPHVESMGFEADPRNYARLCGGNYFDFCFNEDWTEQIDRIADHCRNAFAFVFLDPTKNWDKHIGGLEMLATAAPRADFAVHCNTHALLRIRRASERKPEHNYPKVRFGDLLRQRPHHLIREPYDTISQQTWSIIYLSNASQNSYAKYGFHRTDSEKGQRFIEQVTLTKDEQAALWRKQNPQRRLF